MGFGVREEFQGGRRWFAMSESGLRSSVFSLQSSVFLAQIDRVKDTCVVGVDRFHIGVKRLGCFAALA